MTLKILIYLSVLPYLLVLFASCNQNQAKGIYIAVNKGYQPREQLFTLSSLNKEQIKDLSNLIIKISDNNREIQKRYITAMPYKPNKLEFYIAPFYENNQAPLWSPFYIDNDIFINYIDESWFSKTKIKKLNISKYFTEQEKIKLSEIEDIWYNSKNQ